MEKRNAQDRMFDYSVQGDILIAVKQMVEQNKDETLQQVHELINSIGIEEPQGRVDERFKADWICQYLQMLYQAQNVGHNVHDEITEALKELKKECGVGG